MVKIIKDVDLKAANYGNFFVQELLNDKDHLSFSRLVISNKMKLRSFDKKFYFYILSGKGELLFVDKKMVVCKGNLVFIPAKTSFGFSGNLELLRISND